MPAALSAAPPLSPQSDADASGMTCPRCGSTDIARVNCDARWDEAAQEWLAGDPEICICDDCDEQFAQPREVEIKEAA